MNSDVKSKWVAALRSGEYNQTRHFLRDKQGYCCLGVLCAIHSKEVGGEPVAVGTAYGVGPACYLGQNSALPAQVCSWADLDPFPCVVPPLSSGTGLSLTMCNDDRRMSFEQIADLIEQSL